jgi:hypothetical protein
MVRDRDHVAVARRARRDARRLQAAWDNYAAKAKALADIRPCPSIWPNSLDDVAPVPCQLLEGHVQREGTRHRHRMLGSQATVEWD